MTPAHRDRVNREQALVLKLVDAQLDLALSDVELLQGLLAFAERLAGQMVRRQPPKAVLAPPSDRVSLTQPVDGTGRRWAGGARQ